MERNWFYAQEKWWNIELRQCWNPAATSGAWDEASRGIGKHWKVRSGKWKAAK